MEKSVIILNHMFTGDYLNNNIGHEIINLFTADNGENYIYLCRDGKFDNKKYAPKYVIQVRRPAKSVHTLEVVNVACGISPCDETNVTYGGVPVKNIFSHNAQQQDVCVTFHAEKILEPCEGTHIYIKHGDGGKIVANVELTNYNPSRQLREYFEEGSENYIALSEMIETVYLWEKRTDRKVTLTPTDLQRPTTAMEIYGIENRELSYSNAIRYFLLKYPRLLEAIPGIKTQKDAHLDVKREWNNIDLLIEWGNYLIVVENKIFSDINGLSADKSNSNTQLDKYKSIIEQCIKEEKTKDQQGNTITNPYYGKTPLFIFLTPDHNDITIEENSWKKILYSQMYKFLISKEAQNIYGDDIYMKDFIESINSHAVIDYNYNVMRKRFVRAIQKRKP